MKAAKNFYTLQGRYTNKVTDRSARQNEKVHVAGRDGGGGASTAPSLGGSEAAAEIKALRKYILHSKVCPI